MANIVLKTISVFRYVWSAFKEFQKEILLMAVLGFASGLFGGIGISIIIPLFSLLSGQAMGAADLVTRTIQKIFQLVHIPITIPALLIFMVLLFVFKALVLFWAKYYNESVAAAYEKSTRVKLFKNTLGTEWPNLLEYKLGYLERVLSYDVQQSSTLLSNTSTLILTLTTLITYGAIALNISVIITLAMAVFGIIVFFLMKPLFHRTRKLAANIANVYKIVSHQINEAMIGAKMIKANAIEDRIGLEGERQFENLRSARIASAFYSSVLSSAFEPMGFLFIAALFVLNYRLPTFNIASFAVAVYLIQRIFSLIQSLQGQAQDINQLIPYVETVTKYQQMAVAHQESDHGKLPFTFSHQLQFKGVAFQYPEKETTVLANLSFDIEKGAMVGIIGPSGAGKTTIADLLLRLLQPQSGLITLDGVSIQDIKLKQWRSNVGYVPQEVFLLNDTIENNIKFYDETVSRKDVLAAVKLANISEMIEGLPAGLDTEVGERGLKLSGGQRQRIALARVLARKPQILILDEATSALDNESESLIQEAIGNLKGQVTVIVIAHRINTIMRADSVLVLDQGSLVESGKPDDLLNDKGSYLHKVYHL